MNRLQAFLAAALFLGPMAANAGPAIPLPLSDAGTLVLPHLQLASLTPQARDSVSAALLAAQHASLRIRDAEAVIRAATKASAVARHTLEISQNGADCRYRGETDHGNATGLGVMSCKDQIFIGEFRDGRLNGLGGDTMTHDTDAYEGEYRDGARLGFGIERDKDGFYPGRYGFVGRTDMEITGLQDFHDAHWAGNYGFYSGPRIACTLIKGAMLEGSVLDGYGAKFSADGHLIEQGFYRLGMLQNGASPPC
jgi:hypothetical protein